MARELVLLTKFPLLHAKFTFIGAGCTFMPQTVRSWNFAFTVASKLQISCAIITEILILIDSDKCSRYPIGYMYYC